MEIVNLTPHPVVLYQDENVLDTFPASGTVARLKEDTEPGQPIDGRYPTTNVSLGAVDGLPDEKEDVMYLVSMPLLMGMRAAGMDRQDVAYPFGQVRDGEGRIIGCRTFGSLPPTGGNETNATFEAMGLGNESYDHLVRIAARMADVDAPDDEATDMGDEDARVRLIWAAAANARRANLSLAMANAARAVALEICEWATEEVTARDIQRAWTVLAEMIRREKGRAASYARRAEEFRAQASRREAGNDND